MEKFNPEGPGPSFETLQRLSQQLPGMIQQHKQGLEEKKRVNAAQKKPRKMCKICVGGFDFLMTANDVAMTPGICPTCQQSLDEGYTALVSGDRYAFVKSDYISDLAGQMIELTEANFDKIARRAACVKLRAKIEEDKKNHAPDTPEKPAEPS